MPSRNKIAKAALFLLLSGTVIISATFCHNTKLSGKEEFLARIDSAHHYLNINDTVKYVGAKTCMLCHQSIYNSFVHTGMGESFDKATKEKSSAKFGPHVVVYDSAKDFYYHPFWKNDSLYVLEYRTRNSYAQHHGSIIDYSKEDTIYKRIVQINYIIGSGQHTNSHIYNVNGYLYQAPITFYTQLGIWDLAPGFSDGYNSRFTREVGIECMSCHNSYPDFVMGSTNKYTSVPNGITCERCHGPGEVHVKAMQYAHFVDTTKAIDYTIVNPAKLSPELQVEVCERCHLQGNAILKPGKTYYDFRPGMKLSDIMDVFMPKYTGMENEYIMASHLARMKMSRCYLESSKGDNSLEPYKKSFTCVTCHNPHVDVRSQTDNDFNRTCLGCHKQSDCKNITLQIMECNDVHAHAEDSNCVGCHMPKSSTIDIPHVLTTDHYIRIPAKKEDKEKLKKFITLYDVNNPNPSGYTRGLAFIQQFARFESDFPLLLDSAKHYFPDATPQDMRNNFRPLVDIAFYKQDYARLLQYVGVLKPQFILDSILTHKDYTNADAWTAYRIGEAFYQINNIKGANAYYERATKLAPFVLEFQNKLATTLVQLNKLDEAEKVCNYILTQDPDFISAITNKGFIALRRNNAQQAKEFYEKALTLDPDNRQAMLNMVGWYIYTKDYKTAKMYLQNVLQKYPDEEQAKVLLQQLKSMKV